MKDIEDHSIDMILCDLPYAVTQNSWDSIIPFEPLWKQYKRVIKPNAAIVLFSSQPFTSVLMGSNLKGYKYEWIWRKQQGTGFLNAKKQPLRIHENILVFYDIQCTYNPQFTVGTPYKCKAGRATSNYGSQVQVTTTNDGKRYPTDVLDFPYDKNKIHPTQKPVALCEYLIKTYTNEGEIVLDNCMGSGSTGIACLNTNRNFIGIEKDETYFNLAKNRIEEHA